MWLGPYSLLPTCFLILSWLAPALPHKNVRSSKWTGGNFRWHSPAARSVSRSTGRYEPKHVVATRAQVQGDEAFLALPRLRSGVPATLARTSLRPDPLLEPFPSWALQEQDDCRALQSVVDLYLDHRVLWVLDIGIVDTLESPARRCPPKVVGFDSRTGNTVKVIDLSNLTCSSSRLQFVVTEYYQDECFVYVTDAATRTILVYEVNSDRNYRVVLPKVVTVGCTRLDVLYMNLIRRKSDSWLYVTYLSSSRMFAIRTEYLHRVTSSGYVQDMGPKPFRMLILGTDGAAALFFRHEGTNEVYRWDSDYPFKSSKFHVVHTTPDNFVATHIVSDDNRVMILESTFPDYVAGDIGKGIVQSLTTIKGV